MNLSGLILVGIGGWAIYAWVKRAGATGATPGGGSGAAGGSTGGGSGSSSGGSGGGSGSGGSGAGAGSAGGSGSSGSGSGSQVDGRPLAAAGDGEWIAVFDASGFKQGFDQWAWYYNVWLRDHSQPELTGAQMDVILGGEDRNTQLLASEWAARLARLDAVAERSIWET